MILRIDMAFGKGLSVNMKSKWQGVQGWTGIQMAAGTLQDTGYYIYHRSRH